MNKQTLLTGFGPFDSVISNPTQRLVEHFTGEGAPGHDLATLHLPVSYALAPDLLCDALTAGGRDGRPFDNIVMMGVAENSLHWRIECLGRNRGDHSRQDVEGVLPGGQAIVPDEAAILPCSWPNDALVEALRRAGLPAGTSDDAGGFLCNHLLFHGLHRLKRTGSVARAGFLHVPADEATFAAGDPRQPRFTFNQQIAAVNVILQELR